MKDETRSHPSSAVQTGGDGRPVVLSCSGVWKLFGSRPEEYLDRHGGIPTAAELIEANLIGAVRHASLEVRQGEIFIIMGLSGSGKSTLLRCLSRLVEPTAGKVEFEGKNLLKVSEADLINIRRH